MRVSLHTPETAARLRRILTPRLMLRCWTETDAPALLEAITRSVQHLQPFMDWAHQEPQTLEQKTRLLRDFRLRFEQGIDLIYGILDRSGETVIGGTGLHARIGAGAFEIGYWIRAEQTRKGYATETAAALTCIGFRHLGAAVLEIHCDPANVASAAIPRSLGYELMSTMPGWVADPTATPRDTMIWRTAADAFAPSRAAQTSIELAGELV